MSAEHAPPGYTPLEYTINLALSQCKEQLQLLAKQSETIDQLRGENARLREELKDLLSASDNNVQERYNAQFQTLFQQNAVKQAEIDRLKEKLRIVKTKAGKYGLPDLVSSSPAVHTGGAHVGPSCETSPVVGAHELNTRSSARSPDRCIKAEPKSNDSNAASSRKRPRSPSPRARTPLRELSVNADRRAAGDMKRQSNSKYMTTEHGAAAIPELAEDGEDLAHARPRTSVSKKPKTLEDSVYKRLGNLLEGRGPSNPPLYERPTSWPAETKTAEENTPARARVSTSGLLTPNTTTKSTRPKSSISVSRRAAPPGPEDEEPYRSRPVNRLGLTHFKLNPSVNSGLDYAYDHVFRGQARKCHPGCTKECCAKAFRALASTLSRLPGQREPVSDDDLLVQYLGSGSEERVRALTPKARENLLHDARTRLMADAYGKMHRDAHERGKSPPGFWATDMPGSQEVLKNREVAKALEREEVVRRYNEALKPGGKWLFADE